MKRFWFPIIVVGAVFVLAGDIMLSILPKIQADQRIRWETELVLNENGYQYRTVPNGGSRSRINDNQNTQNQGTDNKGKDVEVKEGILSWEDAQDYLEENELKWLCNEYLYIEAEDVVMNVSDKDSLIANYLMQDSKVKIYLFAVEQEGDENFLFGRSFPSALYNIRQIHIGEGYAGQCFSYKGYDGLEYTTAVLVDGHLVCEIKFDNCDETFICKALADYKE